MAEVAVSGLIGVRAFGVAEGVTGRVGEIVWVDNSESVCGNVFGVVVVVFVETFFKGVVDGVDGGFASIVAMHGVKFGFLVNKNGGNGSDEN